MYNIGYATEYRQNDYHTVESEIQDITQDEFMAKAKEITKEYHPVRYIYLENETDILVIYRNKKITVNKLWKE